MQLFCLFTMNPPYLRMDKEMAAHPNSCLENSADRGAWRAARHGVVRSQTQLSTIPPDFCPKPGTPKKILLLLFCSGS